VVSHTGVVGSATTSKPVDDVRFHDDAQRHYTLKLTVQANYVTTVESVEFRLESDLKIGSLVSPNRT